MNYEILKKNEPILILGHNNADFDSIASAYLFQKILNYLDIKNEIVIPDGKIPNTFDCKNFSFNYKTKISKNDNVFLVDHNSTPYNCNVIGYVDHHTQKEFVDNTKIDKPQTSCAKIMFDEMSSLNIPMDKNIYFLVVQSLYLDSMSFNSEKSIEEDKKWSDEICNKYNFNKLNLYNKGLMLTDISNINQATVLNDYKVFEINNKKIGTSCAKLKNIPDDKTIEKLLDEVKYAQNINLNDGWMYYLSCIEDNKTIVFFINEDNVERNDFDGLKSRGKDLKPILEKKISDEQKINIQNTEISR